MRSKILVSLINEEIGLETSLLRLKLIISNLKINKMNNWIDNELNGYNTNCELPAYRRIKSTDFKISGFNSALKVSNNPIDINTLGDEIAGSISEIGIYQGISQMDSIINKNEALVRDVTTAMSLVIKTSLTNYNIYQFVQAYQLTGIKSSIKNKLIDILIELEDKFGNLDEYDIDVSTKTKDELDKIKKHIINIVFQDNSIKIGDKNKIENSNIGEGNKNEN